MFSTSPNDEDCSMIFDPRERWDVYKLKDYVIDQNWAGNCPPPNGCEVLIINNTIADVKFAFSEDAYHGRSMVEIYVQTTNIAMTVDEAFESINKYK